MSVSSISTVSDISADWDDRSSLSEASPIEIPLESTSLGSVVELANLNSDTDPEPTEPFKLEEIDSFLPIFQHLPPHNFVLDNKVYHIYGTLSKTDISCLSEYAKRVGKVTLTDKHANQVRISPDAYLRFALAHAQYSEVPLFPSMHTLLIEDANVSLDHLPLCLTPSLKSLEVSRIPSERQIVFASFLTILLEQVPDLVHLTLKPGRPLSQDILRSSLGFNFLRRLEFMGITGPIGFSLLKNLGAMPELEELAIDTRDAQYQPFKSDAASAVSGSFQRLRKLTITSGLMLMGDLIFHLHPNLGLMELSLTLVKSTGVFGVDVKGTPPSWYSAGPPPLISQTKKPDKVAVKTIPPGAELVFTWMVDQILSRYALELLAINHATPNSFVIPRATIDKMLSCPTLTTLKVGWKVKPLDEILNNLNPPMPALLKVLEFPIGQAMEYESQAHVSTLRHVAECYPHLTRLQCPVQPHSAVGPLYNPTVDPLSHGLKIFSVGGASPSPEQQILIASYLDYLFPTLESIQTHDGVAAVQWDYIYRLYRMCKSARLVSRE